MLTDHSCRIISCLNAAALIVPVYGVLLITTVRLIFVQWPLHQTDILKNTVLIPVMFGIVLFGDFIGSLPCMGLCDVKMNQVAKANVNICEFTDGSDPISSNCIAFYSIYASLGYIIPIILVVAFYAQIVKTAVTAKKNHQTLQNSKQTSTGSKTQNKYKANFRKYWSFGRLAAALERGQVAANAKLERMLIPWSIIFILVEYIFATLIWIPMELLPRQTYELLADQSSTGFLLFDLALTLVFLSLSISPLLYIITSHTLRDVLKDEVTLLAIKLHLIRKPVKPLTPMMNDAKKRCKRKVAQDMSSGYTRELQSP